MKILRTEPKREIQPPKETDVLAQQVITLELENLSLKEQNVMLGIQLVNLELRTLQLENKIEGGL